MRADEASRIQYASKQSSIANGWKKWKGEIQGIEVTDAINKRKELEAEFRTALTKDPALKEKYRGTFRDFDKMYATLSPYAKSKEYVAEIMYRNVDIFKISTKFKRAIKLYKKFGLEKVESMIPAFKESLAAFYKNYDPIIDEQIATSLFTVYFNEVDVSHQSQYARDQIEFAGGDVKIAMQMLFGKSFLTKGVLVMNLLENNPDGFFKQLSGDNLIEFTTQILRESKKLIFEPYDELNLDIQTMQRKYMAALMEVFPDRRFYPDANGTMRVTYGKVEGYTFGDQTFKHSTYLDGLVDKYVPGDYEFDVPLKLRELHEAKDYGQYADKNGKMPVCFIGSNHTSGGNSGSPVIDAHGNFVGINFDRTWHGTMSDINYDPSICRNIMVDARYILFIIDKFAGATYLVDEMTLVHPKK